MVLHHVPKRAGFVVIISSAFDAELFREFSDIAGALDPLAGDPAEHDMEIRR